MLTNRREFFLGLFATAVGSAILPKTVQALTAIASQSKYQRCLDYHDQIVQIYNEHRELKNWEARWDKISPKVNELFDFLMSDAFDHTYRDPKNPRIMNEIQQVFGINRDYIDKSSEFIKTNVLIDPPTVLDGAFVIGVLRSLFAKHKIPADPSKINAWDKFAEVYQDLILNA